MTRAAGTVSAPVASADLTLHPLGKSPTYHWKASESVVDMAMALPEPRRTTIACEPESVVLDLNRTALIVIDMPNQIHLYKPGGTGIGLGEKLPGSGAHVLEKDK